MAERGRGHGVFTGERPRVAELALRPDQLRPVSWQHRRWRGRPDAAFSVTAQAIPETLENVPQTFLEQMMHLQQMALDQYGFLIVDVGGSFGKAITERTKVSEYKPATHESIGHLKLTEVTDIDHIRDDGTKRDFDTIAFPATRQANGSIKLLAFEEVRQIGVKELSRRREEMVARLTEESARIGGPDVSIEAAHYQLPSPLIKGALQGLSNEWRKLKEFVSSIQIYPQEKGGDPRGRIAFRLGAEEQDVPWETMQVVATNVPNPKASEKEIILYTLLPPAEQLRYRVRTLEDKPQDNDKIDPRGILGGLSSDFAEYCQNHQIPVPDFSSWDKFAGRIHDPENSHPTMRLKWHILQAWFNFKIPFRPFKGQSFGEWASHNERWNRRRRLIN